MLHPVDTAFTVLGVLGHTTNAGSVVVGFSSALVGEVGTTVDNIIHASIVLKWTLEALLVMRIVQLLECTRIQLWRFLSRHRVLSPEETLSLGNLLDGQELHDLGTVNLLMMWRVVEVDHEVGELQYLEVEDDVPEKDLVVPYEIVLKQNLVTLLGYYIYEFFIKL